MKIENVILQKSFIIYNVCQKYIVGNHILYFDKNVQCMLILIDIVVCLLVIIDVLISQGKVFVKN